MDEYPQDEVDQLIRSTDKYLLGIAIHAIRKHYWKGSVDLLCKKSGLNKSSLYRYESGVNPPKAFDFIVFLTFFKFSLPMLKHVLMELEKSGAVAKFQELVDAEKRVEDCYKKVAATLLTQERQDESV